MIPEELKIHEILQLHVMANCRQVFIQYCARIMQNHGKHPSEKLSQNITQYCASVMQHHMTLTFTYNFHAFLTNFHVLAL